jgi:methylated-DNA-[protein]-cysteine S-methyltransferase
VFATAAGYCAIAWSDSGIVRMQLPESEAAASERHLRRHIPGARPGTPTISVAEAIAAVQR